MFNPSRDEVRQFFHATWQKRKNGELLSGMESMVAAIIAAHPEYHGAVDADEDARQKDYAPEGGVSNPFLHMSMHLAIEEQLAINQPAGVRDLFEALLTRYGDDHEAQHAVMDCLGEMLWQAQRNGAAPDGAAYLACVRGKAGLA